MNSFSTFVAAKEIAIPVLVLHDENDDDVPIAAAYHIYEHLKNGDLLVTKELGHRKILGDTKVIRKIAAFIQ
jgi:dipeptidyl aminopeptidase/acylaminoacyl peptidase